MWTTFSSLQQIYVNLRQTQCLASILHDVNLHKILAELCLEENYENCEEKLEGLARDLVQVKVPILNIVILKICFSPWIAVMRVPIPKMLSNPAIYFRLNYLLFISFEAELKKKSQNKLGLSCAKLRGYLALFCLVQAYFVYRKIS